MNTELKSIIKSIPTNYRASIELVQTAHEKGPAETRWKFVSGASARTVFLAYAFLRGKAYRATEPTARDLVEKYGPAGKNLAASIAAVAILYGETVTEATVTEWMAVPETEYRRTKREAARAKSRARYEASCAKHAAERAGRILPTVLEKAVA